MENWEGCRKILCIRADNMGDLIMSGPAIRALKESFDASITVLTSSMATPVARLMTEIDEVITFDFPWVKNARSEDEQAFARLIDRLKSLRFDAAVVFTVYSQNPLPAVMIPFLAGIPRRLAWCRENPYQLLTHWAPDNEPYELIRHQVHRDLELVKQVGATVKDNRLGIDVNRELWPGIQTKMQEFGFVKDKKWLIIHAGVSETKREFPADGWIRVARLLIGTGYQVVFTGSKGEQPLTDQLTAETGNGAISAGGLFDIEELVCLIRHAPVILSVNTGTVHIAAATRTPVVVLYALTNPQHTPWKVPSKVFPFRVPAELQSRNVVVRYVNRYFNADAYPMPEPEAIVSAVKSLIAEPQKYLNNELALIHLMQEHAGTC
jgi:lipopolysaccharide heptosyltransferase II